MKTPMPLKRCLDQAEIVVLSDLHIREGDSLQSRLLEEVCKLLSESNAKGDGQRQLVLCGDIFDLMVGGNRGLQQRFRGPIAAISSATRCLPVFYLFGNHEFDLQGHAQLRACVRQGGLSLPWGDGEVFFVHGDLVGAGFCYRLLMSFLRSNMVTWILRRLPAAVLMWSSGVYGRLHSTWDKPSSKKAAAEFGAWLQGSAKELTVIGHYHVPLNLTVQHCRGVVNDYWRNLGFLMLRDKLIYRAYVDQTMTVTSLIALP